jgi:hypothetical protein
MSTKKAAATVNTKDVIRIMFHVAINSNGDYEVIGGKDCDTFEDAVSNYELGGSVTVPFARLTYTLDIPRSHIIVAEPRYLGVAE